MPSRSKPPYQDPNQLTFTFEESRDLLLDLSVEFFDAAADATASIQQQRELEVLRRRSALRLVPSPKMGYEHVYLAALSAERSGAAPEV